MKLNLLSPLTGVRWVKEGCSTFFRQPIAMAGLFLIYTALGAILQLIPFVGNVLSVVIVPAATLGLMAASREAQTGRFPMPAVLFSALRAGRQQLKSMLILGLLYAAACALVVLLYSTLEGGAMEKLAAANGGVVTADILKKSDILGHMVQSLLISFIAYIPIALLFWHAPALVHWHGISPIKSLFFSAVATLRNFGAFAVFGLSWLAVLLITGIVANLLALALGASFAFSLMYAMVLLVSAMLVTSLYPTFRDCFTPNGDETISAST